MEVISSQVISVSRDGKSREIVYHGYGEGNRNRYATKRGDASTRPRRKISLTVHERAPWPGAPQGKSE